MKATTYNRIKHLTFDLVNIYHSVNDRDTKAAVYAQVAAEISVLWPEAISQQFLSGLADQRLTREVAEQALAVVFEQVAVFPEFSDAQVKKAFKKVKKLPKIGLDPADLKGLTYLGWNDLAAGRKYILTADGQGFYGSMTGQIQNICAICQKTSTVTQFLAKTRSNADGTYTKRGTYICLDSQICNGKLESEDNLAHFLEMIKAK